MSQTSIGTETPQDFNENPPNPDMGDDPSRTLGAGFGHTPLPANPPSQQTTEGGPTEASQPPPAADVPADLADDELLANASADDAEQALADFPDGPNVAPSPWEEDAARGLPTPPDADSPV